MKRTIAVAFALLFSAASAYAELHGSWTANTYDTKRDWIQMNLARGRNQNFGNSMKIADFRGLSSAQIDASTSTPVSFTLAREAGTVSFDGSFRNGDGAGQWTFKSNPNYIATLRSMGLDVMTRSKRHDRDRTEEEELFSLAVLDVSTEFIRSMRAEGYDETMDKYVSMRIFNVTPEFIREMRSLGYKNISSDELVASKIHKVTPDFIRKMREAGWGDLTLDELQASRIHGATPEFAAEMAKLGYGNLDHDDLIAFRIHRVTPEFIRDLKELGYDNVRADDLVAMRIHRVTPEYIKELAAAGYRNIPVRKLVEMKIHRIDVKFIEKMNDVD